MSRSSGGKSWGDRSSVSAPGHKGTLTAEERAIAVLLAQGCGTREIATMLSIDKRLVKQRRHDIFQKLGVADPLHLVLYLCHERDGRGSYPEVLR